MSPNEISRRYTSKQADEFYLPDHIRIQDTKNKQGSLKTNDKELTEKAINKINKIYDETYSVYQELLDMGVAREMARTVLPVGQYTEFYLTANARALMHFFNLRADSHAQWEIQEYAKAMANIFEKICPWTYESFIKNDYKGNILD
jgi:thymidylate synthase (FAD)